MKCFGRQDSGSLFPQPARRWTKATREGDNREQQHSEIKDLAESGGAEIAAGRDQIGRDLKGFPSVPHDANERLGIIPQNDRRGRDPFGYLPRSVGAFSRVSDVN